MKQYLNAVQTALTKGTRKHNRTGVDTLSTFNINYSIDVSEGFPLLTTKEISWKNIVIENLWFLSGSTDIRLLQKHGCKFWDPWADPKTSKVPSAYGNFWRHFPTQNPAGEQTFNDQIAYVIGELKHNPMSRRLVVSAWSPGNAQNSALPPCHAFWVLNTQNDEYGVPRLCLHLTQRSADIALGVPYNIAGYAFLLELIAKFTGMKVGEFGHTLIDAHVYTGKADGTMAEYDHLPGLQKQLLREPRALPKLTISDQIASIEDIHSLLELDTADIMQHFVLDGYNPFPKINFKVAV
ncbi:MAG: thymidylate synthase [Saprospiraceae bacterium]|jgi:thymidylate synthase